MSDDSLVAALARAQAKFTTVAKSHEAEVPTKAGGKFTYTYANLADTISAVLPILAAEGIALLQPILMTEFGPVLSTQVRKGSDMIESVFPLRVEGLQPQAVGSLITYSRRYCLTSLLAIATDDDDGQAAQDAPVRYPSEPSYTPRERTYTSERGDDRPQPAGSLPATDKQQGAIVAKLKTCGASKRDEQVALLKHLTGFESVKALTKQQASEVFDALLPYEEGKEWGMFVYSNAGAVSVVNVGEEPFELEGHQ